jgi:hypothetical protein
VGRERSIVSNGKTESIPSKKVPDKVTQSQAAQLSLFVAQGAAELFTESITTSDSSEGCWIWFGTIGEDQVPTLQINEHSIRAARIAWVIYHQTSLLGCKQLRRSCSSAFCVSPLHHHPEQIEDSQQTQLTLTPHPSMDQARELLLGQPIRCSKTPEKLAIYSRKETLGELQHLALASLRQLTKTTETLAKAEQSRASNLGEAIAAIMLVERSQHRLSDSFDRLERGVRGTLNSSVTELSVLTSAEMSKLKEAAHSCRMEANKVPFVDLSKQLDPILESIQQLQQSMATLTSEIQQIRQLVRSPEPRSPRAEPEPTTAAPEPATANAPLPVEPICKLFQQHVGDDIIVQQHEQKDLISAVVVIDWDPAELESKMVAFARHTAGQSRADRSPARFLQMLLQKEI